MPSVLTPHSVNPPSLHADVLSSLVTQVDRSLTISKMTQPLSSSPPILKKSLTMTSAEILPPAEVRSNHSMAPIEDRCGKGKTTTSQVLLTFESGAVDGKQKTQGQRYRKKFIKTIVYLSCTPLRKFENRGSCHVIRKLSTALTKPAPHSRFSKYAPRKLTKSLKSGRSSKRMLREPLLTRTKNFLSSKTTSTTFENSKQKKSIALNSNEEMPTTNNAHTHNYGSLGGECQKLLGPKKESKKGKKTLVLDLDETLVHSSFTFVKDADFVISVEIVNRTYEVYVRKRPGVDEFLQKVAEDFELVVFTASVAKYANPVLDQLDVDRVIDWRLFRESCCFRRGSYVKDLSKLGRDLTQVIIVDNAPVSYLFHPLNAIPISTWFDEKADRELLQLLPLLRDVRDLDDVTMALSTAREDERRSAPDVSG